MRQTFCSFDFPLFFRGHPRKDDSDRFGGIGARSMVRGTSPQFTCLISEAPADRSGFISRSDCRVSCGRSVNAGRDALVPNFWTRQPEKKGTFRPRHRTQYVRCIVTSASVMGTAGSREKKIVSGTTPAVNNKPTTTNTILSARSRFIVPSSQSQTCEPFGATHSEHPIACSGIHAVNSGGILQ